MTTKVLTMSQIAEKSGFSRSTVSHVLNGRADDLRISKRTCEHIQKIALAHNYIANPMARGLRGGQTRAIGILWSLGGPHANESMIRPLNAMLREHNYVSYIFDHDSDPINLIANLKNLRSRGADGIVLQISNQLCLDHPEAADLIRSFRLRVLVTQGPASFDADMVLHDRLAAIREAVAYLLEFGRRRLVYITGSLNANQFKADAIQQAVADFGHGATSDVVLLGQTPLAQSGTVFDASPAMACADAMLFSSDEYAAAGLRWLEQTGRRCPDDVAVVGFNNSEFSQMIKPALATVDRAHLPLVEQIQQLIEYRIDNPEADYQSRYVPMTFICRASAEIQNSISRSGHNQP